MNYTVKKKDCIELPGKNRVRAMQRIAPISVRLTPELERRLEEASERTGIKKHTLAQMAIEAAVKAIEANDFRLVVPLTFDVTHVAVGKHQAEDNVGEPKKSKAA